MWFPNDFSPSLVHCSRTSAPTSFSCWWVTPQWGRWWWPAGDLPGSRLLIGRWGPSLFGWGNSHPNLAHLWDRDSVNIGYPSHRKPFHYCAHSIYQILIENSSFLCFWQRPWLKTEKWTLDVSGGIMFNQCSFFINALQFSIN